MTKENHLTQIRRAVDMGDCAYDGFEHLSAVLEGMAAITKAADINDRTKLMRLERSIKTALYLAHDGAALVDAETEAIKEVLNGGQS